MCHLTFHVLELQNIRSRTSPARHRTWRSYVRPLVSETTRLHPALNFAMSVLVTQVWVCQPRCPAHQLRPGRHQHPPQNRLLHRLRSYSPTPASCFSPLTLCHYLQVSIRDALSVCATPTATSAQRSLTASLTALRFTLTATTTWCVLSASMHCYAHDGLCCAWTQCGVLAQIMLHIDDSDIVNKLTHGASIDDGGVHTTTLSRFLCE